MPNHIIGCPAYHSDNISDCSCSQEQKHYLKLAGISFALFVIQFVGGLLSGSLALMSDALHVLLDGMENIISVTVSRLVQKGKSEKSVRRVGAKLSALLLLTMSMWILYEGFERLLHPQKVEGYMILVAAFGLAVNLWQYRPHHNALPEHKNITHFWQDKHLLSDTATSFAVVLAGIVMTATGGYYWLDGAISIAVGLLIAIYTLAKLFGRELHAHDCGHAHHDHQHKH